MSALSQSTYDNGLRCRGICNFCNERISCYQYRMNQANFTASFEKVYPKTVTVTTSITVNIHEIRNWISECPNIKDLKELSAYALSCAENLENLDIE